MDETFQALRKLMLDNTPGMVVARDGPGGVQLNAPWAHPFKPKEPMWFGGVRPGKNYISYHLMPVYSHPDLAASVSPALKKRMQGKSCFNFKTPDPALFEELAALTRAGAKAYETPLVLEKPKR